ncbi:MAG: hypothetical protein HY748_15940 [Elusimicrobia bacterium]|nr:hypothetical protein [Elusimicrobiota bacterium]
MRPRADPFERRGRLIREAGYNSPFETVAIAEALRRRGIPTTAPLAITRTGHHSAKARFLHDDRRFRYTLWDYFGGGLVGSGATENAVDLETARLKGVVDDAGFRKLSEKSRSDRGKAVLDLDHTAPPSASPPRIGTGGLALTLGRATMLPRRGAGRRSSRWPFCRNRKGAGLVPEMRLAVQARHLNGICTKEDQ